MKNKVFYLGIMLAIIGIAWIYTIVHNMQWYVEHGVSNAYIIGTLTMLAILLAVAGFIIIIAKFDSST